MGKGKGRRVGGARSRFEEIEALFADLGIDTGKPGFYDDPAFLAVERRDPGFLATYGEYVRLRPISADERAAAQRYVPVVATLISEELVATGRLGRCVDASQMATRCLERLGVWNYIVVGAMNASVPAAGGRIERFFWVVDDLDPGAGQLGHVWLAAPPYDLVDVTFGQQGWPPAMRAAVPRLLIAETTRPASATANDIMAPQYQTFYRRQFGRPVPPRHFLGTGTDYPAFARRFPGFALTDGAVTARYFPTGIQAPDASFENMFKGDVVRFWNERVVPALGVAPIGPGIPC